jgi:hypothetical protein
MHCPRCGQQQVSDQVKFCYRCGFLLGLVSEVLANGGTLPQLAELNQNKKFLTRKNGIKTAVMWTIVMWFLLVPVFGILDVEELAGAAAVLGFAGGIILMLLSFFFLENPKAAYNSQAVNFRSDYMPQNLSGNAQGQNALPLQQSVPASTYVPPQQLGRWQTTSDLTAPGSVTERTTKLLEKDE